MEKPDYSQMKNKFYLLVRSNMYRLVVGLNKSTEQDQNYLALVAQDGWH